LTFETYPALLTSLVEAVKKNPPVTDEIVNESVAILESLTPGHVCNVLTPLIGGELFRFKFTGTEPVFIEIEQVNATPIVTVVGHVRFSVPTFEFEIFEIK
jgi:hypothetical protein